MVETRHTDEIELERDIVKFSVYVSERRCIDIGINSGKFSMEVCDYGPECKAIFGRDEYEFVYSLDERDTVKLMKHLRDKYDFGLTTEEVLKSEFGKDSRSVDFRKLCGKLKIEPMFWSF